MVEPLCQIVFVNGELWWVVTHAELRKHHRRAKLRSLWLALELATLEHALFGADVNTSRAHHAHSKRWEPLSVIPCLSWITTKCSHWPYGACMGRWAGPCLLAVPYPFGLGPYGSTWAQDGHIHCNIIIIIRPGPTKGQCGELCILPRIRTHMMLDAVMGIADVTNSCNTLVPPKLNRALPNVSDQLQYCCSSWSRCGLRTISPATASLHSLMAASRVIWQGGRRHLCHTRTCHAMLMFMKKALVPQEWSFAYCMCCHCICI